jgi:uncharacterized membrane protein YfcA
LVYLIVLGICFISCLVGAICGIGGGVIIKPALDVLGIMDVATISFLSGCSVLAMTTYSVIRSKAGGGSRIDEHLGAPLALGAALGGIFGKNLFQVLRTVSGDAQWVGAVQAGCLLVVTAGTLVYTLRKERINTHRVRNAPALLVIGLLLGILSSFLGIGGGPINLVFLFFFCSMDTKTAAENSLYIIWFSQIASLLYSIFTRTVPQFSPAMLCLMVLGGILGGICGQSANKKLDSRQVDHLFIALMVLMIGINAYNVYKFLGL